jgi:hypothetical protein
MTNIPLSINFATRAPGCCRAPGTSNPLINDMILIWGKQRRNMTKADLLGRLLRGIVKKEARPSHANAVR